MLSVSSDDDGVCIHNSLVGLVNIITSWLVMRHCQWCMRIYEYVGQEEKADWCNQTKDFLIFLCLHS